MEDMNIEMDNATTIIEEVTDKLTFKENCTAYAITGIFATGVITIGYLSFKGGKKLVNKIRNKKVYKNQDKVVVDNDPSDIYEEENETEQD